MIEIRKHGKFVTKRYITRCSKCGCEFYFDRADYIGENGKWVEIKCPECGQSWGGRYMGDIAWSAEIVVDVNNPPKEFDFESRINPNIRYHAVENKKDYLVTSDSGCMWHFSKAEIRDRLAKGDYYFI